MVEGLMTASLVALERPRKQGQRVVEGAPDFGGRCPRLRQPTMSLRIMGSLKRGGQSRLVEAAGEQRRAAKARMKDEMNWRAGRGQRPRPLARLGAKGSSGK